MTIQFNRLLVHFAGGVFIFSCFAVFFSISVISSSYAQEKTTNTGAEEIKKLLLRPSGWEAEWHCDHWPGDWMTDLIFEARKEKIVVKINDPVNHFDCKRKVKIISDGFTMGSCNTAAVFLVFDPNDQMYPFKGENSSCIVKLKAK